KAGTSYRKLPFLGFEKKNRQGEVRKPRIASLRPRSYGVAGTGVTDGSDKTEGKRSTEASRSLSGFKRSFSLPAAPEPRHRWVTFCWRETRRSCADSPAFG